MGDWRFFSGLGNVHRLAAGLETRLYGRPDACRHDAAIFAEGEVGGGDQVRISEFGLRSVGSSLWLDWFGAQRRRYTLGRFTAIKRFGFFDRINRMNRIIIR
jgi:hypothetical protein